MDTAFQPAPAGRRIHYERRRPEETTLYQLVQEHLEAFLAQVEAETGSGLPEFVKEEFDAFLECGILAHGFLRLRCADCAQEKLVAFSCKRRGFCPACGARRRVETAAHRVDRVIPRVPVRQCPSSRGRCRPRPSQTRASAINALGSSMYRLAHDAV
jgi:Transposase zinc-binding domain